MEELLSMFNKAMAKRITAALVVTACLTSMAACGSDAAVATSDNTATTAVTNTTEAATTQPQTKGIHVVGEGGQEITTAATEASTEAVTQASAEARTEAATQAPTEAATEAAAAAATQAAVAAQNSSSETIGKDDEVITVVNTTGSAAAWAQYNANYAAYVEVIRLTNELRASLGVAPLTMDETFCVASCSKATDYHMNNFYDGANHSMVDGRIWKSIFTDYGISSTARAENLARGQKTAREIFNAWKNSPVHYENLVNPTYSRVGVGSCGYTWIQLFAD